MEYARAKGIKARKLSFGEGWPDYMFLYAGRTLFIEFKQLGEKPDPLQLYVHSELRALGFQVEVVDSPDTGRQLIKEWYDRSNKHVATLRRGDDQNQRSGPDVQRYQGAKPNQIP